MGRNWFGETPQEEYFRRKNNQEKWGNPGGPIDAVAHSLFKFLAPFIIPIILIYLAVKFIAQHWMYIVSIAVIAIACVLTCKHLNRKVRNPEKKISLTIIISIGLILGVFYIVPKIQNSGTRTTPVSRSQTAPAQMRYMLVNTDALNVRKGPSADHDVMGQLKKGDRVQVLDSSGQWWRIKSGNIEGYVNSAYLINEDKAPPAPVSQLPVRLTVTAPGMGTTRSVQYQREWEETYDRASPTLPSGLVLPSGETVGERIQSGRVTGK
jgi:SH3-like domain-containing protein